MLQPHIKLSESLPLQVVNSFCTQVPVESLIHFLPLHANSEKSEERVRKYLMTSIGIA